VIMAVSVVSVRRVIKVITGKFVIFSELELLLFVSVLCKLSDLLRVFKSYVFNRLVSANRVYRVFRLSGTIRFFQSFVIYQGC
jgi:hypothetical protein